MNETSAVKHIIFKICPGCNYGWSSRTDFLIDPNVEIIGYQADFRELIEGLFLFNHSCGTTLAIRAKLFIDLYNGPIFQQRLSDSEKCPGYCSIRDNFMSCELKCECAYVRETIQIVKNWPKSNT
jgi:hypothetical protein